ncbi:hypothetical protein BDV35DRAFT_244785 [Aspergillus flavus]|uniref:Transmembrane protein n=1 Tax=Aspergillus flavus TaxID=5059 RepID=A0A5N6GXQ9_ASPFL|nr:hypothetical protein BDV35DRAFT_244785 [Aspergillus flavus]
MRKYSHDCRLISTVPMLSFNPINNFEEEWSSKEFFCLVAWGRLEVVVVVVVVVVALGRFFSSYSFSSSVFCF